ncbi:MAG TPA: BMC domain-containing protein [Kiritimatiellae bacterium]|nr:BMC domain-containing protein [Kiritimatiellia bacterium]
MKRLPAIGVIELADIPRGILATDAMLKDSPVATLKTGVISPARYLTVVGGTPAAVEHSLREGRFTAADALLDSLYLPDVHAELMAGIVGSRAEAESQPALLVTVSPTCCACLLAAERALKGTPVRLLELRLADPSLQGRGLTVLCGRLPDVEAAGEITRAVLDAREGPFSVQIISAPHESLQAALRDTTDFGSAPEIPVPDADAAVSRQVAFEEDL